MTDVFEKRDPAFDRIIGDSPRLDHLATGFGFTEGPVWRGDHLLFSDIPNSRIVRYELAEEGPRVTTFRYPSGNSNGMTLDRERRLVTCEHTHRRVSRTGNDGRLTVLANRYDGRRFNSPNDVVVKSDGSVYFTDPPFGLAGQSQGKEQEVNGVYRVSPDGSEIDLVAAGHGAPQRPRLFARTRASCTWTTPRSATSSPSTWGTTARSAATAACSPNSGQTRRACRTA